MKNFPDWFFDKSSWQEKTLGENFVVRMCKRVYKNETSENGEIPFYKIGTFGKKADSYISKELFEKYRKNFSFPEIGDTLVSCSGTVGICVVYDGNPAYFQDSNIVWLELKTNMKFDKKFLYFCLSRLKWDKLSASTIKRIYSEDLLSKTIKLPPLEVQKKIADYFTHLDNAINAQDLKLKSWRDAKKAMLQKIFAQEFYFTQGSGEKYPAWQEKTLGDVCSYISKRGTCLQIDYVGTENMLQNFSGVDFKNETEKIFTGISYQVDDILFSNIRPYLKKVWKANKKGCASTDILVIRAEKNISAGFLYYSVANDEFISKVMTSAKGTKMPRGDKNFIMSLKIKIPCIEEQKKIAEYFSSLDKIIDAENKMLESLRQMKRGLLQKLFV